MSTAKEKVVKTLIFFSQSFIVFILIIGTFSFSICAGIILKIYFTKNQTYLDLPIGRNVMVIVSSKDLSVKKAAYSLVVKMAAEELKENILKAKIKFYRKYDTAASRMLDHELDIYDVRQEHYDKVDALIDKVKNEINQFRGLNKLEESKRAKTIFKMIYSAISGGIRKNFKSSTWLLSQSLDDKLMNCDKTATLYFAVGEALNLPFVAVEFPKKHIGVAWKLKNNELYYWETTSGWYLKIKNLKEEPKFLGAKTASKIKILPLKKMPNYNNLMAAYEENENSLQSVSSRITSAAKKDVYANYDSWFSK